MLGKAVGENVLLAAYSYLSYLCC